MVGEGVSRAARTTLREGEGDTETRRSRDLRRAKHRMVGRQKWSLDSNSVTTADEACKATITYEEEGTQEW